MRAWIVYLTLFKIFCRCEEEDLYYDDYYEEEVDLYGVETNGEVSSPVEHFVGYFKSPNNESVKVSQLLVSEIYLNLTSETYDCVKRVEAGILALEPNTTEEAEPEIGKQVNDLRKKMEEVASIAAGLANGTDPRQIRRSSVENNGNNTSASTNETTEAEPEVQESIKKRLSFRERQELKMKERMEQELAREMLRPKFRLGSDCETLICGACKVVVEELGRAIYRAVNDTKYRYIDDVAKELCLSKEVKLKYVDLVSDVCSSMEQVCVIIVTCIIMLVQICMLHNRKQQDIWGRY